MSCRIHLPERPRDLVLFPYDTAKHSVYKGFQIEESFFLRQPDRLVYRSAVRHTVHIKDLIDRRS